MTERISRTRVYCGVCGYSAPRRSGDKVGRHYVYTGSGKYVCGGTGHLASETHEPPLVGTRTRAPLEGP